MHCPFHLRYLHERIVLSRTKDCDIAGRCIVKLNVLYNTISTPRAWLSCSLLYSIMIL